VARQPLANLALTEKASSGLVHLSISDSTRNPEARPSHKRVRTIVPLWFRRNEVTMRYKNVEALVPVDFSRIQGPGRSATENFEQLCALLIARDFPGARAVDGKGGDGGVDAFLPPSAAHSNPSNVFQCKLFTETLKGGQKRQIEESLQRACETFKPGKWIL
jgi:hypothetical protein